MSVPFDPDYVVAPGETLRDWFASTGEPVDGSAVGIGEWTLGRILSGEEPISMALAGKLAALTGISTKMWIALEQNYRRGLTAGKHRVGS